MAAIELGWCKVEERSISQGASTSEPLDQIDRFSRWAASMRQRSHAQLPAALRQSESRQTLIELNGEPRRGCAETLYGPYGPYMGQSRKAGSLGPHGSGRAWPSPMRVGTVLVVIFASSTVVHDQ